MVKHPYRLIVFLFFFVICLNTAARAQFFFNNQTFTIVPASQADPEHIALSDELSDTVLLPFCQARFKLEL